MSPEDLEGQLRRAAAVERQLRDQIAKLERDVKTAKALGAYQAGLASGGGIAELVETNTRLSAEVDAIARTAERWSHERIVAMAENDSLRGALKTRGIHDRTCGAVKVPGRFGSQEGLRWNQSTDPLSCTCPLGVAILGCELGKTPRERSNG